MNDLKTDDIDATLSQKAALCQKITVSARNLATLITQLVNVEQARIGARQALENLFPVGTRVKVKLKEGQTNWTRGTVVGFPNSQDGYVRVEIDTAKVCSRQKYRNIHYTKVYEVQP